MDSRGMISLKFREHKHVQYLAEESPDGVITLTPAALVPARLAADLRSPLGDLLEKMPSRDDIKDKIREMPL